VCGGAEGEPGRVCVWWCRTLPGAHERGRMAGNSETAHSSQWLSGRPVKSEARSGWARRRGFSRMDESTGMCQAASLQSTRA
jgi:hypothetical protein